MTVCSAAIVRRAALLNRRDRTSFAKVGKSESLPLRNADDTDRNSGIEGDIPGVESTKSFEC
jgi:hypothetical protein